MGGERFDTPQPESYLFGENTDLNFLGSRPTPVKMHFFSWIVLGLIELIVSVPLSSPSTKRANQNPEMLGQHQERVP